VPFYRVRVIDPNWPNFQDFAYIRRYIGLM